MLPWTCPNELVALLIGDVGKLLQGVAASADHRSNCRRNGLSINSQLLQSIRITPLAKTIPRKLSRLIKAMWGRKCQEHNQTMTRTYLRQDHGIMIEPLALLLASQQPNIKKEEISNSCWHGIQSVELIAMRRAVVEVRRGRRTRGIRRT